MNVSSRSPGCETETAFDFQDASDGEAAVGLAIVSRCSDSAVTCTLAYGGTANRTTGRSVNLEADNDLGSLTDDLVQWSQGVEGSIDSDENVSAEVEAMRASLEAQD